MHSSTHFRPLPPKKERIKSTYFYSMIIIIPLVLKVLLSPYTILPSFPSCCLFALFFIKEKKEKEKRNESGINKNENDEKK